MRDVSNAPPSGRFLSFVEREEIALMRAQSAGVRQIARVLGRSPSTISRELRRNAATRAGRVKNGPPLAGHGAQAVRDAIASTITVLPAALRKTLAWDQGAEMAQHAQLRIDTNLQIFCCDPRSPWQRPSNENTNGLLRQYFPMGTDLSRYTREDLEAVAMALNNRPRKTLACKTPAEAFNHHLLLLQSSGVATTG